VAAGRGQAGQAGHAVGGLSGRGPGTRAGPVWKAVWKDLLGPEIGLG
jgi:hypothetical protein